MIKQPFIFLKQNYLKQIYGEDGTTALNLAAAINGLQTADLPAEITLYFSDDYGTIINRQIDTLYLKGTNLVNFTVQYADSLAVYHDLFTLTGNTAADVLLKAQTAVNTSSLKIIIPANGNPAQIALNAIGISEYLIDLCALTNADFNLDCDSGSYRTANGRIIHYANYAKWKSKIKADNLPQAQFNTLKAEILSTQRLTVIPFKDYDLNAIYDCYINPEISYEVNRKTGLMSLDFEAQEL